MRTTARWYRDLGSFVALLAVLGAVGCGNDFPSVSEVKTLRVLGVQKDKPYPAVGDDVQLSMLWHDGSEAAPRDIQRLWIGGCLNPPGDLFYECRDQLAAALNATLGELDGDAIELPDPGALPAGSLVGVGDTFHITVPPDAVRTAVPGVPDYGVMYVWYALCAGTLGPARVEGPFPLACFDENDNELDVTDFVVGYTTLYVFDEIRNENPRVLGLTVEGTRVPPDCIDADCVGLDVPDADDLDCDHVPCIPACTKKHDCPEYEIEPLVDRDSLEFDPVGSIAGGTRNEQFWSSYYVNAGSLDREGALLHDPVAGWQDQISTKLTAPREPGVLEFWGVIHDNRGGTSWLRQSILVTEGDE